MGNKMKKLICALLASTMVLSSVGMIGFADETTTDIDTPDVTEETVATEAPAVTEAPVATGSAYDNDNYYQKALSLNSALGIITGYEDGSVKPDSKVTRAEMASIVLRMLDITSMSTYQNGFTDVTSSHWAADQIQTAQEAKIISGMGDGTFVPDGEVTYAQVAVMLVNAMNYQTDAEYAGGYPNGYLKTAASSDLELTKNAPGSADVASERGVVIKMVYNALLGQYKEIDGYENGAAIYRAKGTLAKAKFDLIDEKGVLTATAKTSITSTDVQDGQIEIKDSDNKYIVYDCALTGLEEYLAQKITYYYKENDGRTPEVYAVAYDSSKTTTETIDVDDIDEIAGFESNAGTIKVNGVSKKKDCENAEIIYNGKVISKSEKESIADINDLLLPEVGTIKIVDSDKDGKFDVLFVDSYETMIVTSAGEENLIGKMYDSENGGTKSVTLKLDDSIDRKISVIKADSEVKLRNLKKNDVASIRRSLDESVVDIIVTGESVTGSASGISTRVDKAYATINGTRYDVANVALADLKTGTQGIFYLDNFGRIAYIDGASAGRLASGEKYGWIIDGYMSEDGSNYILSMITQEGKVEEFKFASSVDYWAPKDITGSTTKTESQMKDIFEDLLSDDSKFTQLWEIKRLSSGSAVHVDRPRECSPLVPIRLVKYKANASNKLSRIYCAVNVVNEAEYYYDPDSGDIANRKYITDTYLKDSQIESLKNSDALIVDMFTKAGSTLVGGMLAGYSVTDDMFEFGVPKTSADFNNVDAYSVKNVNSSEYNQRENGLSDTFIFADMDGISPAAVIRLVDDATKPVVPADMDNVGNTAAMVVDEISIGVDDEDNRIYTIDGYSNGAEVSVTTKKTSALAELTGYNDKKYATGEVLWDAEASTSLTNFLHKGDIIITDGSHILLYSCVEDVYNTLKADPTASASKYVTGSNTRNYFKFDRLNDYELDDVSWITVGSDKLSIDPSKLMDTVEIDLSRPFDKAVSIDTEGSTISDLSSYSAELGGDYAFARFANKGDLQEVMIYRIKPAE